LLLGDKQHFCPAYQANALHDCRASTGGLEARQSWSALVRRQHRPLQRKRSIMVRCDTLDIMESPRWWAPVAGVVAAVFLYYETGSWIVVGLCAAILAGLVIYQSSLRRNVLCLKCGAKLNPNARECKSCGSASWTVRE
jgi:ribosomal protein L40E